MLTNFHHHLNTRYMRTTSAAILGAFLSWSAQATPAMDFDAGYMALINQDYVKSIAEFTSAIDSGNMYRPHLAIAYHLRGVDYLKTGRDDEAIADFNRAIAINPGLATAWNDRGIAFRRKGDFSRAVNDYNEAIRLKPNVDSFYLNRGLAHAKSGQWDEAITDYKQAVFYKPASALAWVALGDAHMQKGHNNEAVVAYQRAMRENGDLLNMYPGVAFKLAALGSPATPNGVASSGKPPTKVVSVNPESASSAFVLSDNP